MRKNKKEGVKRKFVKAAALSQIFIFVLSSFAFAFIIGGMFIFNLESVSGADTDTKVKITYRGFTSTSTKYSNSYRDSGFTDLEDLDIADAKLTSTPNPASRTLETLTAPSTTSADTESNVKLISEVDGSDSFQQTPLADDTINYYDQKTGKIYNVDDFTGVVNSEQTGTPNKYDKPKGWDAFSSDGLFLGNAIEGVGWGVAILTLTNVIAGFMTSENSKNNIKAFGTAMAAGLFAGKTVYGALLKADNKYQLFGGNGINGETKFGLSPAGWGVLVGVAVAYFTYASMYKKEKIKTDSVEFKCMTWQAPLGGLDCNKCNGNPLQPCSEYRCKSLGQTCKIINAGTGQDRCIDGGVNDVTSPGIKPWKEILTSGYTYANVKERPPGGEGPAGMKIISQEEGGCLKPFTPFVFGIITTDIGGVTQPAQCKVDFNHTKNFDEMNYYMNEDNLYVENHSQAMSLPGVDLVEKLIRESNSSLPVKNDGEYNLYIRCRDGNGNENRDEFEVDFCIDKSPDLTAPQIKATNPPVDSAVLYQIDNASIEVYTNEPVNCRWNRKDASYSNMENQMECSNELWEMNAEFLYTCKTTLTGIKDKSENKFYFRCEDLSNNTMQESFEYNLFGTQPLSILNVGPNGTISGATSTVTTTLNVKTDNGFRNGEAKCFYSNQANSNFIEMVETGGNTHKQPLDLTGGKYVYYFRCIDAGGNTVLNYTNFTIFVDKYSPIVARAYNFEGKLTIATDEDSTCKYSLNSCNYDINKEGIDMSDPNNKVHSAIWKTTQTYYIKCMDKDNNQPGPSECSMIVRPYRLTQEESA